MVCQLLPVVDRRGAWRTRARASSAGKFLPQGVPETASSPEEPDIPIDDQPARSGRSRHAHGHRVRSSARENPATSESTCCVSISTRRKVETEFGFIGSWLDLGRLGLGSGPGHIARASVLLPCLGRCPSVSICGVVLVYVSSCGAPLCFDLHHALLHERPHETGQIPRHGHRSDLVVVPERQPFEHLWSRCCAFQLWAIASGCDSCVACGSGTSAHHRR